MRNIESESDRQEPWRLTFIMDGPIEHKNPPLAVVQRRNLHELTAGERISDKTYRVSKKANEEGVDILSAVLLRTPGGYVDVGQPLLGSIAYLAYLGIDTTAFVDERAESYGAKILAECGRRIGRANATLMWHQTFQHSENNQNIGKTKPQLSYPRELFRSRLRAWLETNVAPEHQHWVLARAEAAFNDPDNHLDDVEFTGLELKRAGLLDEAVTKRRSLGAAYAKTMQSSPENWPTHVRRFFKI